VSVVETMAVRAMALAGLTDAVPKGRDAAGIFASAFITACGGGAVREMLPDRRPATAGSGLGPDSPGSCGEASRAPWHGACST